jgi:hypothetical protein
VAGGCEDEVIVLIEQNLIFGTNTKYNQPKANKDQTYNNVGKMTRRKKTQFKLITLVASFQRINQTKRCRRTIANKNKVEQLNHDYTHIYILIYMTNTRVKRTENSSTTFFDLINIVIYIIKTKPVHNASCKSQC